jgi:3-hydroxyisobutyrate dehydrogenase
MASSLVRDGLEVRAWNRTRGKLDELAREASVAVFDDPAEAAAGAEVILTMLSDGNATLEVIEAAAAGAEGDVVWAQMGTIGIDAAELCIDAAERLGLTLVDAPVLGTKQPAEAGELVILGSGPQEARERLGPLFEAVGKRTMWVGEAGAGSRLKVVVNAWIVSVVEGTAEAIALAEGVGVEPRLLLQAVEGGPLDMPYMRTKGESMLRREFPPAFRLALAAKDARLALAAAQGAGLQLPMLEAIADRMAEAAREHGEEDLAATYLASAASVA